MRNYLLPLPKIISLVKFVYTYIFALLLSLSPLLAQVTFDCDFECGSVGDVELVSNLGDSVLHYRVKSKFDPLNRYYPERAASNRWFYFRMTGVKGKRVALDINYNDSKRPMYSYDNVDFHRFDAQSVPVLDSTVTMLYSRDTAYIAYFVPYTLSRNDSKIEQWQESPHCITFDMGQTPQHNAQRAIIITDTPRGVIDADTTKEVVYIHGRIHPSETPSSWHLEAMIDTLLGESQTAKALRQRAIFYILPITNPDGVYAGLSRTNPQGINLEVNYNERGRKESQEVKNIKRLFDTFHKSGITPALTLNMHSQSTPKVCYWIHSSASTSQRYHLRQMLMGSLTAWQNPYFDFKELSYSSVKDIYLEGYVYHLFEGRTTALTFETPYSYYHQSADCEWVTVDNLRALGSISLRSILEFIDWGK